MPQTSPYKIKALLESGVDFSKVYPEKQTVVQEMTGFAFNLATIVNFLKNQTDNFQTVGNSVALDLDNSIYDTYVRWEAEHGQQEKEPVNTEVAEWTEAIETLKMLVDMGGTKEEVAEWTEAIETLEMLKTG